jgi:hypothetical protein
VSDSAIETTATELTANESEVERLSAKTFGSRRITPLAFSNSKSTPDSVSRNPDTAVWAEPDVKTSLVLRTSVKVVAALEVASSMS